MNEFDAEQMVREIMAGAERGKRIAVARLTWPQLGEGLWAYHDTALATFYPGETRTSIVVHRESFIPPEPGSPASTDAEALTDRELNPNNELLLRIAHMYIGGIVNHVGGLATIVQNEVSARPAIALARVILDASAHCCHLLASDITAAERTVRAANIQVEMMLAEKNDSEQVPLGDEARQAEEIQSIDDDLAKLHSGAANDGLPRVLSRKQVPQPYLQPGPARMDQLLTAFGGDDLYRSEWRHGSSVVHVKERTMIEFLIGSGDTKQEVHGRAYGSMKLMPAILMATEALNYASEYLGADGADLDTSRNQLLNYWSFATGMRDGEIAARIGLDP